MASRSYKINKITNSTKSFRPTFNKPKINDVSFPESEYNHSNDGSMINSRPSSILKNPRMSSNRPSANKFGFSTEQYKKLQIIKSARQINMKLMMTLNRLKYNKFHLAVLKAFYELLEIVHNKNHAEIVDWRTMILTLYKQQSKIIIEVNEVANLVEKGDFDEDRLCESRKLYFKDTQTETSLYKHCMGSKEIRSMLQFLFSVYNYVRDLRK